MERINKSRTNIVTASRVYGARQSPSPTLRLHRQWNRLAMAFHCTKFE